MNIGENMQCVVLVDGKPSEQRVPVTVRKFTRNGKTGEVASVRVKVRGVKDKFLWVQPQYLLPEEASVEPLSASETIQTPT